MKPAQEAVNEPHDKDLANTENIYSFTDATAATGGGIYGGSWTVQVVWAVITRWVR